MTTVAQRLRERTHQLSRQERRAARVLTADYPNAGLGTSAQLAAAAGVSAPTVVRFARSLGYSGYAELQAALLGELTARAASPVSQFQPAADDETPEHWLGRDASRLCRTIGPSLASVAPTEADAAVRLLADPHMKIACIGGRYSNVVAAYLAMHLQQLRPSVTFPVNLDWYATAGAVDAGKNSVFVLYDVRRYQRSTVELARRLSARGAHIILITDPWMSPAATVADVVLPTSVESPTPFDSLTCAFILSELLIGAVLRALGDRAIARMKQFEATSEYQALP